MNEKTFYESWQSLKPHHAPFKLGERYVCRFASSDHKSGEIVTCTNPDAELPAFTFDGTGRSVVLAAASANILLAKLPTDDKAEAPPSPDEKLDKACANLNTFIQSANAETLRQLQECAESRPQPTNSQYYEAKDRAKYSYVPMCYPDGTSDHYCHMRSLNAVRERPIDPAIDHAMKKLAWAGARGVKDLKRDYLEAILSIQRAIEALPDVDQSTTTNQTDKGA